jgi:hypothetical protein
MHRDESGEKRTLRVSNQARATKAEVIQQTCHIVGHGVTISCRIGRLGALTVTTLVEGDDVMVRSQRIGKPRPHFERIRPAMQQDNRVASSNLAVADANLTD